MKDIIGNMFGFLYTLSMGDYIFFISAFILMMCFVYIICLIKKDDSMETYYKNEDSEYLNMVKETIEKEYEPSISNLTDYEEEQEKNAIISYEELLKNKKNRAISYDEKYRNENKEIIVKKINIDKEGKILEEEPSELKVKLMSYDKEEAFLTALKQLQHNLTN